MGGGEEGMQSGQEGFGMAERLRLVSLETFKIINNVARKYIENVYGDYYNVRRDRRTVGFEMWTTTRKEGPNSSQVAGKSNPLFNWLSAQFYLTSSTASVFFFCISFKDKRFS